MTKLLQTTIAGSLPKPAFNVYFDEVRDWGVGTLERAAQGLACTTAVHICYGYGIKANID
jgi:5-methyltetrahydropteroyltriglutamate--homocysteine methyltransferase